jgi:hypothetical protein
LININIILILNINRRKISNDDNINFKVFNRIISIKNFIDFLKDNEIINDKKIFEFSKEELNSINIKNPIQKIKTVKEINTNEEYIGNVFDLDIKNHNSYLRNISNEKNMNYYQKRNLI